MGFFSINCYLPLFQVPVLMPGASHSGLILNMILLSWFFLCHNWRIAIEPGELTKQAPP
jgi:hypothetical protein